MVQKILGGQTDFSAGELDPEVKRSDDALMKTGARQCANFRILNSKKLANRPGRRVLFIENGRVEKFTMSGGTIFHIVFGTGYLRIYTAAGALAFSTTVKGDSVTAIPWTTATVGSIVYVIYQRSIYITYGDDAPVNVPLILTWDGVVSWTLVNYLNESFPGYGRRVPFYHISPKNIALWSSAGAGSVTLTASSPLFTAGWVGARINFAYRQMVVTAFTDSQHVTATVSSLTLPATAQITWSGIVPGQFSVGQIVIGSISSAEGVVVATDSSNIYLLYLTDVIFVTSDTIVGQTGNSGGATLGIVGVTYASITTSGITIWDDEAMNNFRGWPRSCFIDQGRLGFCDFPAVPSFVVWSAFGDFLDIYTDPANAGPTNAILEIAPGNSRVLHVVPGMESSEFVFCDNALYYVPISVTNPLKPGSVAFNKISSDGAAAVQPKAVGSVILYIDQGLRQVYSVVTVGAYNRPYESSPLTDNYAHLFHGITAIALPTSVTQFPERHAYILNNDGTVAVGKYVIDEKGAISGKVGWVPWSGGGSVKWVSALNDAVLFDTDYVLGGATVHLVEQLDATLYLDAGITVNAAPAALAPPGGKGPLWWAPNGSVTLMDLGTRQMGTYLIDANGFIVPQFIGGENLSSAQLVAGQPWTATFEPFIADAAPGNDVGQRMFKRRVSRFAAYVMNSTGFLMARLFSGPLTQTSPALGTIMNTYRVTTYNQDDDATKAPPLREEAQRWRPLGRAFDPRVAIIKDTPGPLTIAESSTEATI